MTIEQVREGHRGEVVRTSSGQRPTELPDRRPYCVHQVRRRGHRPDSGLVPAQARASSPRSTSASTGT
ncbi:MAG: hypothetical protein ACRDPR_18620, partial [Nocardioidaceae bacterium]